MRPLPMLPASPSSDLRGIARLAASALPLEPRNDVDYRILETKSVLQRQPNPALPFRFTINPYRGCEFGCRYCYARYTHEYMELRDPADFERRVFLKAGAEEILAREIRRPGVRGERIAIGTATDPYQPAERRFGQTRRILEALADAGGMDVSVTTKSDLVVRDADLLARLAASGRVRVLISVTTADRDLARALEPRAPTPEKRLGAVRALVERGVSVGVMACPSLPFVTDGERELDALLGAARAAGAGVLIANLLFLRGAARAVYIPFVRERFPGAAPRFAALYAGSADPPAWYRERWAERVSRLRVRHGLSARFEDDGWAPPAPVRERQGLLAFADGPPREESLPGQPVPWRPP